MGATRLTERSGGESALQASGVALLRRTIRGEVVVPGDVAYDQARKVWNGMVDRRPAAIVFCAGSDDVVAGSNSRGRAICLPPCAPAATTLPVRQYAMAVSSSIFRA